MPLPEYNSLIENLEDCCHNNVDVVRALSEISSVKCTALTAGGTNFSLLQSIISKSLCTYELLKEAMMRNDVELFGFISQHKGFPHESTWLDYELLLKAIELGQKSIVELLLDNGARVYKRPGITSPLHLAVTKLGWLGVVERLLETGARVSHQDARGDTPLHLAFYAAAAAVAAADHQSHHVVDVLLRYHLRGSSDVAMNHECLTFLHIACTTMHVDVVEKLVKANGAFIDFRVQTRSSPSPLYAGYTPLRFAVEHGCYEVVEFLLKNGANICASEDFSRSTPLHYAFERRDFRMIDVILAHTKEQYDWDNNVGITHFMLACTGSQAHVVKRYIDDLIANAKPWTKSSDLINKCVDDVGDYEGYTPLHFAVEFGHVDSIETLLNYRADCCTKNSSALTAHQLAMRCRDQSICDLLAAHCKVRGDYNRTRSTNPTFAEQAKDVAKDIQFAAMKLFYKTRNCTRTLSP